MQWRSLSVVLALVAAPSAAFATEGVPCSADDPGKSPAGDDAAKSHPCGCSEAAPAGDDPAKFLAGEERPAPRREVTLGLGYGGIVSPGGVRNDAGAGARMYETNFTGWTIEVTGRRFPKFEYGLAAWSTGGSSNGTGSYAHVLLRFAVEARWLPWGFGRVEPWIGAELGLALADDYAKWDATADERAHSVSKARIGEGAGAGVGVRGRLGDYFALGLRGGLLYMNFPRVRGPVTEAGDTKGVYVVYPTDYGRRVWYSLMLSAEVTVPD